MSVVIICDRKCHHGEIGRPGRFRFFCVTACRFESDWWYLMGVQLEGGADDS